MTCLQQTSFNSKNYSIIISSVWIEKVKDNGISGLLGVLFSSLSLLTIKNIFKFFVM